MDAEFFGDVVCVNGKAWPFKNVEPRKYRMRILNGSNSRFYNLELTGGATMTQIGTDGGFLQAPVPIPKLLIAPGERATWCSTSQEPAATSTSWTPRSHPRRSAPPPRSQG